MGSPLSATRKYNRCDYFEMEKLELFDMMKNH